MERVLRLTLLLAVALSLLTGCASALDAATRTSNGTAAFLTATHDGLEDLHRAARDAAVNAASTPEEAAAAAQAVHVRFQVAWDAYTAARAAWLVCVATLQAANAADAAGRDPDLPAIARALASLTAATEDLGVAIDHLAHPVAPPGKPVPAPAHAHTPAGAQ